MKSFEKEDLATDRFCRFDLFDQHILPMFRLLILIRYSVCENIAMVDFQTLFNDSIIMFCKYIFLTTSWI